MAVQTVAQESYTSMHIDQVITLDEALKENHISYEEIRPLVHERVAALFLRQADPSHEFLIQSDSADLFTLTSRADFLSRTWIKFFLEKAHSIFDQRINEKIDFLNQLENNASDEATDDWDESYFPLDLYESNDRFLNRIKTSLAEAQVDNNNLSMEIEAELCRISNVQDRLQPLVLEQLLKSYAASFDPHTAFFSVEDEGLLLSALSNEVYSTGILLKREHFGIFISQIMPYSDASKYEELSGNDEIVAIKVEEQWQSARCMDIAGLVLAFYGTEEGILEVQIKSSKDQRVREFLLEKQFLRSSQNHVFRYLMKKGDMKIAYIRFPSFYSKMTKWGNSSAQDLALDLIELKAQDLDGLVVDLRNNGGGAITEAVDLAGLFIDAGPLFITTSKETPNGYLHKDTRRGTVFSDKVMFLTNSGTASASEVVVSALRKYPNQLVVGAKTFGKSTGQGFVYLKSPSNDELFGILKVTRLRVYGMDGNSYQGEGVTPDIEIPELSYFSTYENQLEYRLTYPSVSKSFKPRVSRNLPLDVLRQKSQQRIDQDSVFQRILALQGRLETLDDSSPEALQQFIKSLEDWKLPDWEPVFEVIGMEDDPAFYDQSKKLEEKALQDPVLNQSVLIFEDWINQN